MVSLSAGKHQNLTALACRQRRMATSSRPTQYQNVAKKDIVAGAFSGHRDRIGTSERVDEIRAHRIVASIDEVGEVDAWNRDRIGQRVRGDPDESIRAGRRVDGRYDIRGNTC